MNIPEKLQQAIENEVARFALPDIAAARQRLTERYRNRDNANLSFMRTDSERCAYIAARMPATYAVCRKVFDELLLCDSSSAIESLLDLGAGPGTAAWAASIAFETITSITLAEQDHDLIAIGKTLAKASESSAMQQASWLQSHLSGTSKFIPHDLVVCSYAAGELPAETLLAFVERCWESTNKFFVIIEPGTPLGFKRLVAVRNHLIALGGFVVAPCTHMQACPLAKGTAWCHFAERFERSFVHAHIKEGSLGYEDEKYSYLIFSKAPVALSAGRLLSDPMKRSGHVVLHLCTAGGEEHKTISKRTKEEYKIARKLTWGSSTFIT